VQAIGRGIETNVSGRHLPVELFARARHDVVYHSPPAKFIEQMHGYVFLQI
jgi:hypothetical protein